MACLAAGGGWLRNPADDVGEYEQDDGGSVKVFVAFGRFIILLHDVENQKYDEPQYCQYAVDEADEANEDVAA